jgi:hypothetical protein
MLLCSVVEAERRRPLPDLALTTVDGTAVDRDAVKLDGQHLIVYVDDECAPCDAVLSALADAAAALPAARIAVIVGSDAARTKAMSERYPALAESRWLVDGTRDGFRALELAGTPTALGVRDEAIEWRLSGVAVKGPRLRSIFQSWLTAGAAK